ncbi:MAG: hypothetical protein H0X33_04830 [Taibaiella sp.]|nr:hypothetical protein [Taibaiella sp.]
MVKTKYLLLTAGFCTALAAQPALAQESRSGNMPATTSGAQWGARDMTYRGQNFDVLDSNLIPKSRMAQHRKFLKNQYPFPAKPRSMWEVGFGGGLYNILGDVPSLMPWQKGGFGLDVQVRKSWGHVISTRVQYIYGIGKGLDYQLATSFANNPAWSAYYAPGNATNHTTTPIVYNYRTETHQLNLDVVFTICNINFYKARTGVSLYAFGGLGALAFGSRINTLDANNKPYDFKSIIGNSSTTYSNRNDVRKKLQAAMDNTYETPGESDAGTQKPRIFKNKTLDWSPSAGAGMEIRLSKRVNLQIEDRVTVPGNEDLLDGDRWEQVVNNTPILSHANDIINYMNVGINFNLGNKRKNVEPLYWLNPLDFAYNELNYPRHMVLPEPILPDADGDGITDQFDKCPGTPAGVAVDSHGCPMDTDGDGVPDFRDKQLITPTECQPVDADGVGKCPCPDGCGTKTTSECGSIGANSINFSSNSARVTPTMQAQLATLAAQMQANPTCKVVIVGAGNGSKIQQQRSWDRVNALIEYMSEKHNIDRNRFIFQYGQAGDANNVMYRSAMNGEEGPANVAPPFPNLRRGE